MSISVPAGVASSPRRALYALVALVLGLACTVLWLIASTVPMGGMLDEPGVSVMAGMSEPAAAVATAPAVAAEIANDAGPAMASMCDTACTGEVIDVCILAAGLIVTTMMALLVGSRRDTFLGLLARPRLSTLVRRQRWVRTPWTALSLSSLGVLRL